jgi:hypothetical protein
MENTSFNDEELERPGLVLDQQTVNWNHKKSVYIAILTAYTLPVGLFCVYANYMYPAFRQWGYLFFGLTFCLVGTFVLVTLLRNWEVFMKDQILDASTHQKENFTPSPSTKIPESIFQTSEAAFVSDNGEEIEAQHISPEEIEDISAPFLDEIANLKNVLNQQESEFKKESSDLKTELLTFQNKSISLEEEVLRKTKELKEVSEEKREFFAKSERLEKELLVTKEHYQAQIEDKRKLLKEKEESILKQQFNLNKSEKLNKSLSERVSDLNFELKTLLELEEMNLPIRSRVLQSDSKIEESEPDTTLCKQSLRCLEILHEMQGGCSSSDYSVVDLRLLQEKFDLIETCLVLLYSPSLARVLYVNPFIKECSGLTTDRCIQDFDSLISSEKETWYQTIESLEENKENELHLNLKDIEMEGRISYVSTGVFKGNALLVALPVANKIK